MQLNRIGNIEQEGDLLDLDQIERDMEAELEDDDPAADDAQPQSPAAQASEAPKQATPAAQNNNAQNSNFLGANAKGKSPLSKFQQQGPMRPGFFPGQMVPANTDTPANKRDAMQNFFSLFDSKFDKRLRPVNKGASDPSKAKTETVDVGKPETQSQPRGQRSRFGRQTVEALLSVGALPMQLLVELGRFRHAKENRFFSMLRLERGLGQGNEDAERFVAINPNKVKKKDPAPAPVSISAPAPK